MAKAYNSIGWENGTKEAEAYVTINGVDYEVTPEQWDGNTPVDATNLDHMEKGIENSYDVEIIAYTDVAPSECATGDIYYNTTNKLLYKATGTNTWSSEGYEPLEGILYVLFDSEKNQGNSYAWNGTDLSSVGGGSSNDVVISDEQPTTDDWKIWIDSGETNNLGSEVTNEYSESEQLAYSCAYSNAKEYELDFNTTQIIRSSAYQAFKTGKIVTITGRFGTYDNKLVVNTNTTFANLPDAIKPKSSIYTDAELINNNSASYLGQARITITPSGELVVRPFTVASNVMIDIYMTVTYLTD